MNIIERAATDIFEILRDLPTPRDAAIALAIVRANLWIANDGGTVAEMVKDDNDGAMRAWEAITGARKAS